MLHGLPVACRGEGGSFFEKTCVLERFVLWRHFRRDWRSNGGYVAISHHHVSCRPWKQYAPLTSNRRGLWCCRDRRAGGERKWAWKSHSQRECAKWYFVCICMCALSRWISDQNEVEDEWKQTFKQRRLVVCVMALTAEVQPDRR